MEFNISIKFFLIRYSFHFRLTKVCAALCAAEAVSLGNFLAACFFSDQGAMHIVKPAFWEDNPDVVVCFFPLVKVCEELWKHFTRYIILVKAQQG